ncbi:MAG: hypothetical protein NTW86_06900 [Candidatus Sumerlaeota bacterium]|nr:hypothetical protein [Candidatus Sumerlaeota bacterium]
MRRPLWMWSAFVWTMAACSAAGAAGEADLPQVGAPKTAARMAMPGASGTEIKPLPTPEQARSALDALEPRIKQCEEAARSLAPYVREQAGIIGRLIDAIQEDGARKEPFFQDEALLEQSECAALLGSLKEELDLIDRNGKLAVQAPNKTVNVRDLGAVGDGQHDDGPALNEAVRRAAANAIQLRNAQDVVVTGNRIQSAHPVVIDNCALVRVNRNAFQMPAGAAAKGVELGPRADAATIEIRDNPTRVAE